MNARTGIEWTEATWNPVVGCDYVSPGCTHCYAARFARRMRGLPKYAGLTTDKGAWTGRVRCLPERLEEPLHWRKPWMIFVNSMSDLFHEDVPFGFIDKVFAVMALAPRHTFQVLTKRAERMRGWFNNKGWDCNKFMTEATTQTRVDFQCGQFAEDGKCSWECASLGAERVNEDWPLPNVFLGVSAEDQKRADERIPLLLQTPAAVRFVSLEPLLGPVDVGPYLGGLREKILNWVIAGGESGPGARPSDLSWYRSLRDQCKTARIPFFMKQITEHGRKLPFDSWPKDLNVREFPQ